MVTDLLAAIEGITKRGVGAATRARMGAATLVDNRAARENILDYVLSLSLLWELRCKREKLGVNDGDGKEAEMDECRVRDGRDDGTTEQQKQTGKLKILGSVEGSRID